MGIESTMGVGSTIGMGPTIVTGSTMGMGFTIASTKSCHAKEASDPIRANMRQAQSPLKKKKKNVHF